MRARSDERWADSIGRQAWLALATRTTLTGPLLGRLRREPRSALGWWATGRGDLSTSPSRR